MGFPVRFLVTRAVDDWFTDFQWLLLLFVVYEPRGPADQNCCSDAAHDTRRGNKCSRGTIFQRVPSSDYSIVGIFGNKISTQCFHSLWIIHLWRWGFHFDISQYVQLQPSFWLQLISQLTLYLFRFHTGSSKYASVQQNEEFTWISSYLIITFYSWY